MPTGQLKYEVLVDYDRGVVSLNETGKAFDRVGKTAQKTGRQSGTALDSVGLKVTNLNQLLELTKKAFNFLSLPMEKIIEIGSKFEDLRLQLDTVLQSAEKGEKYFAWIKDFSSRTPFQIEGLTETVILLENFGINGRKYLKTFGDAASGLKIPMKDLGLVMGQIFTKPKAQSEEMLQLMERGIPVTKILKEELDLTAAQVGDIGREGIEGKKVFEALAAGMEKLYGGAMERAAKAWSGMMSTLKDKVQLFIGTIAGPVLENLKGRLDALLGKIDQWAKDGTLERVAGEIASFVSEVVNTIGNIVSTIWKWRDAIILAGKAWLVFFSISKLNEWGKTFNGILSKVSGKFSTFIGNMKGTISGFRGETGLLRTSLKNVGSVAGAAFAGWQIGRLIAEVTGLDKAVSKMFDSLLVKTQEYYDKRAMQRNMTAEQRDMTAMIEKTRELSKSYGITTNNLKQIYIELYKNKEAYAQVDPAMKGYIENIVQKQAHLEKTRKAQEALKKATAAHGQQVAAVAAIDAKYLDIMKKYNIPLEAAQKLYQKLNPEMSDVIKLAKELNITEAEAEKILDDLYKKSMADYKQKQELIKVQNEFRGDLLITNDALRENAVINGWVTEAVTNTTGALEVSKSTWEKVREGILKGNDVLQTTRGILSQLGIEFGPVVSGLFDLGNGIAQFASGDYLGGAISILSSFKGILSSLTEPDWGARARKALGGFEGVTEDMEKQLEELSKELGSTEAAFRSLLAEFIEAAEISSYEGFATWAAEVENLQYKLQELTANAEEYNEVRKALEDADSHMTDELLKQMSSLDEIAGQVEDSFNSLVKKSQELGYEGSKAMLDVIAQAKELRDQGYAMTGLTQYIEEGLKGGIDALGGYIKEAADVAKQIEETEARLAGLDVGSDEWAEATDELAKLKAQFGEVSNEENFGRAIQYAMGFMQSLQAEGKSMMEIIEMMGPQLDGLAAMASAGGYETGGLSEMLKLREFLNDNQEVMNSIDASTKMLEAFANTGYMTSDLFKGFQQDAMDYYNKLTEGGKNEKEALQAMLPYLAQMKFYAEANNLELDEHTKKLIADAEAQGMNLDSMKSTEQIQQEMNQSLKDLVSILSQVHGITTDNTKAFSDMAKTAVSGFSQAAAGAKNLKNSVGNLGGNTKPGDLPPPASDLPLPKIPGFAKGTKGWLEVAEETLIRVGEGNQKEFLNVVPEREAIAKAQDARSAQKKVEAAQAALMQKAQGQMVQEAIIMQAELSRQGDTQMIDHAGGADMAQAAQDAIFERAEAEFQAEAKIEPKITPTLPPVTVNVSDSRQAKREPTKQENKMSLVSQDQVNVKLEGVPGNLDEEKLAVTLKRVIASNTNGAYEKFVDQLKKDGYLSKD